MEIFAPLCFLAAFLSSPLTRSIPTLQWSPLSPPPVLADVGTLSISVPNASALLALLFLAHYVNRALLSPLRTPMRSKSHMSVPLASIMFNAVNGSLMGAFIGALATPWNGTSGIGIVGYPRSTVSGNWVFWEGVGMWALGFASNIWHDEVLLNLRPNQQTVDPKNPRAKKQHSVKPYYAIPHGGLYGLISYQKYFSEWFEWLGYAIAASALTSQLPDTHVVFPFAEGRIGLCEMLCDVLTWSSHGSLSNLPYISQLTPPWLFFFAEVFLMLPRAWNAHKWYHDVFSDYPHERKAIVPFWL